MCYKLLAAIFVYKFFICTCVQNLSKAVSKFSLCCNRVMSTNCINCAIIQGNSKVCRSICNKLYFIIVCCNSNAYIYKLAFKIHYGTVGKSRNSDCFSTEICCRIDVAVCANIIFCTTGVDSRCKRNWESVFDCLKLCCIQTVTCINFT